jgi:hypothetical protein
LTPTARVSASGRKKRLFVAVARLARSFGFSVSQTGLYPENL